MRKRNIKSVAHWVIMSVLLLFPVLMVGISSFAGQEQTINVEESYEYQTNDVNSVDDLIEGNIYKVNVSNLNPNGEQVMNLSYLRFENQGLNETQVIVSQTTGVLTYEFLSNDTLRLKYYAEIDNTSVVYFLPIPLIDNSIEFYAVYQLPHLTRTNVTFSRSDYLGEHLLDYTIENETMREDINQWCSSFRNLPVNQWYGDMLDTIGLGITNSMMMNVIYTYPLYVLWVYIIDLLVDCLLVIINFGHNALKRLGGDNE